MRRFHVGVQLHPQDTTLDDLRQRGTRRRRPRRRLDLGVGPLLSRSTATPTPPTSRPTRLLAALAVDTERARLGALVTCNSYRNPNLLADMARTIDHLSHGRFILGIGSGWFERDYTEYGYDVRHRGRSPAGARARPADHPRPAWRSSPRRPVGALPILIGGAGEKVTLRIVAEHADAWNTFGPPEAFARKNAILDQHCADVGRDPAAIERTVAIQPNEVGDADAFVEAGATHLIVMAGHPFDLATRCAPAARRRRGLSPGASGARSRR